MGKSQFRKVMLMLADIIILSFTGICCYFILSFFDAASVASATSFNKTISIATILCMLASFAILSICGTYTIVWRYVNIKEYILCVIDVLAGVLCAWGMSSLLGIVTPWVFWAMYFVISSVGLVMFRILFKTAFLSVISGANLTGKKRTLIVGGGEAAKILITEMSTNENCEYFPICMVDDNKDLLHTEYKEIPVLGTTTDIMDLCVTENIEVIVLAIPSCSEEDRKRIIDICNSTKLEVKILPYLSDVLFGGKTLLNQVKDIRIEDLLGRDPVSFDNEDVEIFVGGKTVMVTGGGGSIGSELCRQIAMYRPKALIIVDIYENNAYEIQQELVMEYGSRLKLNTIIASVRDYDRMNQIFDRFRPDIVFHAAAHKHVPLMEVSAVEAVKNNIFGTFNCATLADYYGVSKFVMISTDKAVNPTNVMGATKRCCEMIVQYMAQQGSKTEFVTTRFGNVLGSNGSVIPLFKKQIESGRPVTVTHPDIIRYFMTIPEAVSLVLQAGAMASGGEIFVLDMGAPVKIVTLAENLIRLYGKKPYKDVEIQFTGLRPGEKLFEEMLMDEEGLTDTEHKKIHIGNQIKINMTEFIGELNELKRIAYTNNAEGTVELLGKIVPTFRHNKGMNVDSAAKKSAEQAGA